MKYKILIAVMTEATAFEKCVSKCPDKSKLIIVNDWRDPLVEEQCKRLEQQGAEVVRHPENIGCAGAQNIGLERIISDNLDFCIILSPSALFKNSVEDFVRIISKQEKKNKEYFYRTIANHQTDMHAFAVTRRCVDEVGLYDENFYPVYFEDTDYSYRMKLIGAERFICYPNRISQDLGGGVKDPEVFDLYWKNINHIHDYYIRKWGGDHMQEKFTHPFNNPDLSIKDWSLEEDRIIRR